MAGVTLDALPGLTAESVEGFEDERGHRRRVDRPLMRHRLGLSEPAGEPPDPAETPDIRLWRCVVNPLLPVEGVLSCKVDGPLLRWAPRPALEVWTEGELCGLHALWWIAVKRGRPELLRRCLDAAAWHVENLQPDNATNHPWGLHVFLALAAGGGEAADGATVHAETLLHNCLVSMGRPDLFSAHILADAADALDRGTAPFAGNARMIR